MDHFGRFAWHWVRVCVGDPEDRAYILCRAHHTRTRRGVIGRFTTTMQNIIDAVPIFVRINQFFILNGSFVWKSETSQEQFEPWEGQLISSLKLIMKGRSPVSGTCIIDEQYDVTQPKWTLWRHSTKMNAMTSWLYVSLFHLSSFLKYEILRKIRSIIPSCSSSLLGRKFMRKYSWNRDIRRKITHFRKFN